MFFLKYYQSSFSITTLFLFRLKNMNAELFVKNLVVKSSPQREFGMAIRIGLGRFIKQIPHLYADDKKNCIVVFKNLLLNLSESLCFEVPTPDFNLWPSYAFPLAKYVADKYAINLLILKPNQSGIWNVGEDFQHVVSLIKPPNGSNQILVIRAWQVQFVRNYFFNFGFSVPDIKRPNQTVQCSLYGNSFRTMSVKKKMKDFMDVIRIIPELFVNREFNLNQGFDDPVGMGSFCKTKYESFTVFKCTDA